ncbi:acid-sensing ion channel 2-like [Anneissia japonica]|uniref:acid-sensing ion channel 2-like n=1 Tax=Anneissia japonica TaxID=1529436 RepID=UPI0014255F57|nr:acid-sensing ion channel 2-like [Anneissia japonica]
MSSSRGYRGPRFIEMDQAETYAGLGYSPPRFMHSGQGINNFPNSKKTNSNNSIYSLKLRNSNEYLKGNESEEHEKVSFIKWAEEVSDCHGLKHVFKLESSILRRGIWFLFWVAMLCLLFYQCYLTMDAYIEHEHITKFDVEYEDRLLFPAVTICNLNMYKLSAITEEDIYFIGEPLGIIDANRNLLKSEVYPERFRELVNKTDWEKFEKEEKKEDFNMTEFVRRTSFQLSEILLYCNFHGEECGEQDFDHVFTHLGNCYTFNKYRNDSSLKYSKRAGAADGLTVTLDVDTADYTPISEGSQVPSDVGVKVQLHNATEPPYVYEQGETVMPGTHTQIGFVREEVIALPAPFGTCHDLGVTKYGYFEHYSYSGCRIECETEAVFEKCGCRLVEQPSKGGTVPVCSIEKYECAVQQLDNYTYGHTDFECDCRLPCSSVIYPLTLSSARLNPRFMKYQLQTLPSEYNTSKKYGDNYTYGHTDFECDCRLPCSSVIYPLTLSSARLNPRFMKYQIKTFPPREYNTSKITEEYVQNNIMKVSVYYNQLSYQRVLQVASLDFFTLLSQIGGSMGLCVGASLLTIVQMVDFCFDVIKEKVRGRIIRKRQNMEDL